MPRKPAWNAESAELGTFLSTFGALDNAAWHTLFVVDDFGMTQAYLILLWLRLDLIELIKCSDLLRCQDPARGHMVEKTPSGRKTYNVLLMHPRQREGPRVLEK